MHRTNRRLPKSVSAICPPEEPAGAFEHTAEFRRGARSLYECFHNIDGENLFEALIALCDEGIRINRAVLFQ